MGGIALCGWGFGLSEEWRAVVGYEGSYAVSNQGNVKSLRRNRLLKPEVTRNGHLRVTFSVAGELDRRTVHSLVLEAFVGPRPQGQFGCHWNDIPGDNRLENLRWGTPSDNNADTGRNSGFWQSKKTHCPQGHLYDAENTYWYPPRSGRASSRLCRACNRTRAKEFKRGIRQA